MGYKNTQQPTDKEIDQADKAVRMLLYCNVMTIASTELVEQLIKEDKFKHNTKHRVKLLNNTIDQVYKECCRVFGGEDNKLCDHYGSRSYALLKDVDGSIYLQGSNKWYQIMCSLSRLIQKYNKMLERSYYFIQAEYLYGIDRKLDCLAYSSDSVIDIIIDSIDCKIEINK